MTSIAETAALLVGGALIAWGAYLAYKPAGPIVGGMLLTAGLLFRATRARR
jgi:hypothetical protein